MGVNTVYEWEGDATQPFSTNYTWKGKRFLLPVLTTFSCARVIAEYGDRLDHYDLVIARLAAIARNNARISAGVIGGAIGEDPVAEWLAVNGDTLETVPDAPTYSGDWAFTLYIYVGGELKFTKIVYSSVPFRLPDGFRGRDWEFEFKGNVTLRRFDMASSMEELKTNDAPQGD